MLCGSFCPRPGPGGPAGPSWTGMSRVQGGAGPHASLHHCPAVRPGRPRALVVTRRLLTPAPWGPNRLRWTLCLSLLPAGWCGTQNWQCSFFVLYCPEADPHEDSGLGSPCSACARFSFLPPFSWHMSPQGALHMMGSPTPAPGPTRSGCSLQGHLQSWVALAALFSFSLPPCLPSLGTER